MSTLEAFGGLSPRFDAFLFAPVGEDRNGMLVSVLSALARFGVDPWKEAATLADLPQSDAAERLDLIIRALADVPSVVANHREIATQLVVQLQKASANNTGVHGAIGLTTLTPRNQIILWVTVMLMLMISQSIVLQRNPGTSGGGAPGVSSVPTTSLDTRTR